MKLWVVGKYIKETEDGAIWDFQGIFESKQKAIEACINKDYFIAPTKLNKIYPEKQEDWKGCYYPKML